MGSQDFTRLPLNSPMRNLVRQTTVLTFLLILGLPAARTAPGNERGTVRFATFNVSLYRDAAGRLADDLATGDDPQARRVAEIIQRVRPDVLLLNEFDFDPNGRAIDAFQRNYLEVGRSGLVPIRFRHRYVAPVNTGVPSGHDLDGDGRTNGPGDAFGFGRFGGQYGMVVLSRLPLAEDRIRSFRTFLWKDMPGARWPRDPDTGEPYYSDAARSVLRLASKNLWDIPIVWDEREVHFIVSHPTPPVFDGPEDRNGLRNHDEIRLLADYLDPQRSRYIYDDHGRRGGMGSNVPFVVAGDLNADPHDGDSRREAITALLRHPRVRAGLAPASRGGTAAAKTDGGANETHRGDPSHDTSDFANDQRVGNLRLDYVLPSRLLEIVDSGVFWPLPAEDGQAAITASDHRLVWVDLRFPSGRGRAE